MQSKIKQRVYTAINAALAYVKNEKAFSVPEHLKSPSPKGYFYPHDFGGWVEQNYLKSLFIFMRSLGCWI
jgi:putative ATPase